MDVTKAFRHKVGHFVCLFFSCFCLLVFARDFQLLLLLIAVVVSSVDIASHAWFFRPLFRASCRFNDSELWLRTFSYSHMSLQKASTSFTDCGSLTN